MTRLTDNRSQQHEVMGIEYKNRHYGGKYQINIQTLSRYLSYLDLSSLLGDMYGIAMKVIIINALRSTHLRAECMHI